MNINRHNYETFFLLYVDKELSATDRKTVELFVQENPDLQMELTLLQQTVLPADEVVLHKKDWLYMEEDISALQENLLLYADGELEAAGKNTVALLLDTNTSAKLEWDILQQTKLQPDMAVTFPDKQSLYRKEAGRVVGFKWWRVAAAAVLLGLGLWTGVSVYKNNFQKTDDTGDVVKENSPAEKQKKQATPADIKQTVPAVESTIAANNTATTVTQQADSKTAEKNTATAQSVKDINEQNSTVADQNTAVQNNKKPGNNLPKPYFENINNKKSNETITANVQSENNNALRISGNNEAVVKTYPTENNTGNTDINTGRINTNMTALQVVNSNPADNGENNNSYLNVDDNKAKRSALGGFIRKAKRVLERTTNVKTGEGIKIAGFEIALK